MTTRTRPRLLDLYCGAGGAAMGYARAGFDVVGVDHRAQKNYPFEFHQGEALAYLEEHGGEFDAIHASPPCQLFSAIRKGRWKERQHPDLVEPTRRGLRESGRPYIIENVVGAPLIEPVMLCGTMFGLQTRAGAQLRRHRLFELSFPLDALLWPCQHNRHASAIGVYGGGQHPQRRRVPSTIGVYGHSGGSTRRDYLDFTSFLTSDRREAMGIDWMTNSELSQAIPPAYTEFLGAWLLRHLSAILPPA
ncbi:MAG: DNA cytosine methyltransferase [Anaerolineales bacterium]